MRNKILDKLKIIIDDNKEKVGCSALIAFAILVLLATGGNSTTSDIALTILVCIAIFFTIYVVKITKTMTENNKMESLAWLIIYVGFILILLYQTSKEKVEKGDYRIVYDLDNNQVFEYSAKAEETTKNRIIGLIPFVYPDKNKYYDFRYLGKLVYKDSNYKWTEVAEDENTYGSNVLRGVIKTYKDMPNFCNRFTNEKICKEYETVALYVDSWDYSEDLILKMKRFEMDFPKLDSIDRYLDSILEINSVVEPLFKDSVMKNCVSFEMWFYMEFIYPKIEGYSPIPIERYED